MLQDPSSTPAPAPAAITTTTVETAVQALEGDLSKEPPPPPIILWGLVAIVVLVALGCAVYLLVEATNGNQWARSAILPVGGVALALLAPSPVSALKGK